MSKLVVLLSDFMQSLSKNRKGSDKIVTRRLSLLSVEFLSFLKALSPFKGGDDEEKFGKHWIEKSIEDVIKEADLLAKDNKHLEVYELLNKIKYAGNIEIHWRIGRALFKLSCLNTVNEGMRKQMIWEAYDIIISAFPEGENSSRVHKWAAIIIDRKNGMVGIDCRVRNSEVVKNHLIKCCELDPNDVIAQYLLGRWCYEMSNITWFQRILAKLLYGNPPKSTFEEAQKYLSKAEDLQPKFFLQNTYLLGKTCLKLGQYYKAKHYFGVVSSLPAFTDYEKQCVSDAKKMLKRLAKYNVETKALFYEYPFGTTE